MAARQISPRRAVEFSKQRSEIAERSIAAFHPLQTFQPSNMIGDMADPFRIAAIRQRAAQALRLGLLIALAGAIAYCLDRPAVTTGRPVEAEVLRVGTYSASRVMGGDLPILVVRLPDGSVREVRSSWAAAKNCEPGRWISLLQHGTALQVGIPGCKKTH
jgi:hypothetical protein